MDAFRRAAQGSFRFVSAWRRGFRNQAVTRMTSEPFVVVGSAGIALWQRTVHRPGAEAVVDLDGILAAEFAIPGKCRVAREWWHGKAPGRAGGEATD